MRKNALLSAVAGFLAASCTISTVSTSDDPPVRRSVESLTSSVSSLNEFRAQNGLDTLSRSDRLQAVAEAQARHIATTGQLSHQGPQGGNVGTRSKRQGYEYCVVAENLAMGKMTQPQVISAWTESPRHRENMLNRRVRDYGLAGFDDTYWVLVVGRSC